MTTFILGFFCGCVVASIFCAVVYTLFWMYAKKYDEDGNPITEIKSTTDNLLPPWDMAVEKLPAKCCVCLSEKEVGTATFGQNKPKYVVCYDCYTSDRFLKWLSTYKDGKLLSWLSQK